jgi:hypothetical protein
MSLEISLILELNFKSIFMDYFYECLNFFLQVCKASSILALQTGVTDRRCALCCELATGDEFVVRPLAGTPEQI